MMPLIALVAAYFIGGIPFGYLLVRVLTGKDVRSSGSGNIGATNVLRTTGRLAGVITLLLDIAKGWFAVWLAGRLTGEAVLWTSAAAFVVLLGHVFPVLLGFRGGKGVASFVGAFLRLTPWPLACIVVVFVVVVAVTRYISAGSVVGAITFPLAVYLLLHPPAPVLVAAILGCALVTWRHQENLRRLHAGTENVFSFGSGKK